MAIGQQYLLVKMYPPKVYTEEELKQATNEVVQAKKQKKVVTIAVDADDTSYDDVAISEEKAEKLRRRQERLARESGTDEEPEDEGKKKGIEKPKLKDRED